MASSEHSAIAVYVPHFLSISMTFVYRQLLGVAEHFDPLILTAKVEHQEVFPLPHPIYCRSRTLPERIFCKIVKTITGRYSLLTPSQAYMWKRLLGSKRTKLIHAHFGPAGLAMLPLACSLNLPLLVTFHGYDASTALRNPRYVAGLKQLFAYAHIITVSRYMAEKLVALGGVIPNLAVVYCGIPMEGFRFVERIPPSEKVALGEQIELLQVSNFVEKKGHCFTVRAFRVLLNTYPHCRLTLAGDGPLRSGIETLCRELGILDRVRFVGKVTKDEVSGLMEAADIFVHHSVTAADGDQEGIPTVVMEAMATGLIPVSTIHAGIPELITDGVHGFLAPERDIPAYVAKLREALTCGIEIGQAARSKVESQFNLECQNQKLIDICQKVIDEHPK
jgi:glycosyltransferase involved in cell wall biosynthesis